MMSLFLIFVDAVVVAVVVVVVDVDVVFLRKWKGRN